MRERLASRRDAARRRALALVAVALASFPTAMLLWFAWGRSLGRPLQAVASAAKLAGHDPLLVLVCADAALLHLTLAGWVFLDAGERGLPRTGRLAWSLLVVASGYLGAWAWFAARPARAHRVGDGDA